MAVYFNLDAPRCLRVYVVVAYFLQCVYIVRLIICSFFPVFLIILGFAYIHYCFSLWHAVCSRLQLLAAAGFLDNKCQVVALGRPGFFILLSSPLSALYYALHTSYLMPSMYVPYAFFLFLLLDPLLSSGVCAFLSFPCLACSFLFSSFLFFSFLFFSFLFFSFLFFSCLFFSFLFFSFLFFSFPFFSFTVAWGLSYE